MYIQKILSSKHFSHFICVPVVAVAMLGQAVIAEDETVQATAANIAYGDLADTHLVPTSPAFTLLGVAPSNVIRPTNPKDLGISLLNGTDATGTLQQGVAIEFSPYFLVRSRKLTIAEFEREGFGTRLLANTQISLATSEAASDGDTTRRLAIGFRTVIFDAGDPRRNRALVKKANRLSTVTAAQVADMSLPRTLYEQCRRGLERAPDINSMLPMRGTGGCANFAKLRDDDQVLAKIRKTDPTLILGDGARIEGQNFQSTKAALLAILAEEAVKLSDANATIALLLAEHKKHWLGMFKKQQDAAWNATNLTVGGALTLSSETGAFGGLGGTGFAAYTSYSLGSGAGEPDHLSWFERNAQFVMHARYQTNQLVTALSDAAIDMDPTFEPFLQDVLTFASLLRVRGPRIAKMDTDSSNDPDFAFFGEFSYTRAFRPKVIGDDSSVRYGGGIELKLTKNASFQFSVGKESGSSFKRDGTFALGDLKFAF